MRKLSVVILITLILISCGQPPKKSGENSVPNNPQFEFIQGDTMDEREFWKLINYSFNQSQQNSLSQDKLIVEKLANYSAEQIIDFEVILRQTINKADDFKVIAAEKIIEGWVTDDPYLYFRCWLIGQGENTFNEALKDPDFLAGIIDKKTVTNFELLLYVATDAYKIKTGKKKEDETFPRDVARERDPKLDYDFGAPPTKGIDFKTEDLAGLYPKLWAKFN